MRSQHQQRVDEFMRLAGQKVPESPIEPSEEVRILRAKLILEECLETIKRGLGIEIYLKDEVENPCITSALDAELIFECEYPFNIIETIDGCCDIMVVTTGTLSACGIPDERFQEEVDENNLKKFGPGGYRDGTGKWIKPSDHKPPDIEGVLDKLGAAEVLHEYMQQPITEHQTNQEMQTTTEHRTNKEIVEKLSDGKVMHIEYDPDRFDRNGKYLVLRLDDGDDPKFAYCSRMAARQFAKKAFEYDYLKQMANDILQLVAALEEDSVENATNKAIAAQRKTQ